MNLHLTEKEATILSVAITSLQYQNMTHGHLDGTQQAALDRVETKLKKLFEVRNGAYTGERVDVAIKESE